MKSLLETLREAELEAIKHWFRPGLRVLEVGGGSGFQAKLVASWGYGELMSIDLPGRPFPRPYLFPVEDYDGINIPAPDASFDLIFSSNVLEHVPHLPPLLAEMRRVLKPDGRCVHILPTPAWRLWTCLSHYGDLSRARLNLPRRAVNANGTAVFATSSSSAAVAEQANALQPDESHQRKLTQRLRRVLWAEPHGEYPGALSELYYFSCSRWLKVFGENGFKVQEVVANELFYTGYGLFPNVSLARRRQMARLLGSACRIYVMSKLDP